MTAILRHVSAMVVWWEVKLPWWHRWVIRIECRSVCVCRGL